MDGLKQMETHDRDMNGLVSLARVCHNCAKKNKINERRYEVRPVGAASGEGLRYICQGFDIGDGIRSNCLIRADPELLHEGKDRTSLP